MPRGVRAGRGAPSGVQVGGQNQMPNQFPFKPMSQRQFASKYMPNLLGQMQGGGGSMLPDFASRGGGGRGGRGGRHGHGDPMGPEPAQTNIGPQAFGTYAPEGDKTQFGEPNLTKKTMKGSRNLMSGGLMSGGMFGGMGSMMGGLGGMGSFGGGGMMGGMGGGDPVGFLQMLLPLLGQLQGGQGPITGR